MSKTVQESRSRRFLGKWGETLTRGAAESLPLAAVYTWMARDLGESADEKLFPVRFLAPMVIHIAANWKLAMVEQIVLLVMMNVNTLTINDIMREPRPGEQKLWYLVALAVINLMGAGLLAAYSIDKEDEAAGV